MTSSFQRSVSVNERVYVAMERHEPGLNIQLFCAWRAAEALPSADALRQTLTRVAARNPGTRLVLRGALGWLRWVACGPVPPVHEISVLAVDELGVPDHFFDLAEGPTCDVVRVAGPRAGLLFRCHHAVMDASGLLWMATEVARDLLGAGLEGSDSTLTDDAFVMEKRPQPPRLVPPGPSQPFFAIDPSAPRSAARFPVRDACPSFVARVLAGLAALQGENGPLRHVMVPVDLRNYARGLRCTSNLTLPLFFEVAQRGQWKRWQGALLKRLGKKEPLREVAGAWVVWLPQAVLAALLYVYAAWHRRRGTYPIAALVTQMRLSDVLAAHVEAAFVLPQPSSLPLNITATTVGQHTEVVICSPAGGLSEQDLGAAIALVRRAVDDAAVDGTGYDASDVEA